MYSQIAKTLWNALKAKEASAFSVEKARNAAVQARGAAREAMTLARAAQAISHGHNGGVHRLYGLNTDEKKKGGMAEQLGYGKNPTRQVGCSPMMRFDHGEIHPSLDFYHPVSVPED